MSLIIDLYQQGRINQVENQALSAKERAELAKVEVDDLRRKIEALTIACQALWEIVREQHGLSDDRIQEKMLEIDLRDGKADGRITRRTLRCSGCNRRNSTVRKFCLYCGAPISGGNVFEKT